MHRECQISKHSSSNCLNITLNKTQSQFHRVGAYNLFWHYTLTGSPTDMIRMVVEQCCTLIHWQIVKTIKICIMFIFIFVQYLHNFDDIIRLICVIFATGTTLGIDRLSTLLHALAPSLSFKLTKVESLCGAQQVREIIPCISSDGSRLRRNNKESSYWQIWLAPLSQLHCLLHLNSNTCKVSFRYLHCVWNIFIEFVRYLFMFAKSLSNVWVVQRRGIDKFDLLLCPYFIVFWIWIP